jgi:hypothetical protein
VKGQETETLARATSVSEPMPLFTDSEMGDFRSQWSKVQTGFVDKPRRTVEDADKLVAAVMQRLAKGFANERSALEKQWDRGDNVSTEDLLVGLQRYRSFFDRLLKLCKGRTRRIQQEELGTRVQGLNLIWRQAQQCRSD